MQKDEKNLTLSNMSQQLWMSSGVEKLESQTSSLKQMKLRRGEVIEKSSLKISLRSKL